MPGSQMDLRPFGGVLGVFPCMAPVAWTVVPALGPEPVGISDVANSSALLDLLGAQPQDKFGTHRNPPPFPLSFRR